MLHDTEFVNRFLGLTPKAEAEREKEIQRERKKKKCRSYVELNIDHKTSLNKYKNIEILSSVPVTTMV